MLVPLPTLETLMIAFPSLICSVYLFAPTIIVIFPPASNEVNKLNIIIKKIKGEKLFIFNNYNKLLDSIVIPSLSKKDIAIQKEAYYLEQIIKEEIGILFQKEKKNKEDIEELNKGFDSIYYYFMTKYKFVFSFNLVIK